MRDLTAELLFWADFFPAFAFLAPDPPRTLTLPPVEDLLTALTPLSCLKIASIETTAVVPHLTLYLAGAETIPWETYPDLRDPTSGAPPLTAAAAAET